MGVKSLWSLLTPAGRPVMLEAVEGKSMAIDSSIWIYQFQATMRDKEGRGLVNAHVLGFLRRICKLLFYGIKPVFVFDGGAPALKRMTINERKKKKSGASESHAKIAEKLLAAQMRREALKHAHGYSESNIPSGPVALDEETVYLEDLSGSGAPVTPRKAKAKAQESPSSSAKKARWRDYDPYRLPEVDMDAAVAKVTRSNAPDPRLATEDELRAFIDMMRPEDLDVNSPEFRELPTEVQYEIIGDLRLKSRQMSHKRLQAMLKSSKTPLDFSKAQILNLKQRNSLTQQLLVTTDNIGKSHVYIPVRIASERNKEYMLVKNEGPEGGWVLGITDHGTEEKPIEIDQDEQMTSDQDSDDDDDMEEVPIGETPRSVHDPDLREYQRERALEGIATRQAAAAAKGRPKSTPLRTKTPKSQPLFIPDEDEEGDENGAYEYVTDSELEMMENDQVANAMQASLEDLEAQHVRQAMAVSRRASLNQKRDPSTPDRAGPSRIRSYQKESSSEPEGDLYMPYTPSRLDTALRFANTSRDHEDGTQITPPKANTLRSSFSPGKPEPVPLPVSQSVSDEDDDDMEEVRVASPPALPSSDRIKIPEMQQSDFRDILEITSVPEREEDAARLGEEPLEVQSSSDDDMEEVIPVFPSAPVATQQTVSEVSEQSTWTPHAVSATSSGPTTAPVDFQGQQKSLVASDPNPSSPRPPTNRSLVENDSTTFRLASPSKEHQSAVQPMKSVTTLQHDPEDSSDEELWPKLPSSGGAVAAEDGAAQPEEEFDAANEMNVHEEEGEFARFAAQVQGKDLNSVRREIDEEIRQLHQQRKTAMRDSEDVTQTMVAQIMTMLRLFGIPYITAPMEAEAQCAMLVELGLVDGIITDDSDVFLFGGLRVFKNMFNQSKTVECFLLADLQRELGLDRGTLIRLAYLLGSDYTEGLPGVGPVLAMELLREFPGDDGLHRFRDWWLKVQSGRDTDTDKVSTVRKHFKKRLKDLYLSSDWPNSAVWDAYLHPVVDTSEEPFRWALPDLDGLRDFFRQELSWNAEKVDELLLPIIHKMNKRGQEAAANRQGTLNDFFSVSAGAGPAEPRKRQAYASKRLQALVTAHRKAQKQRAKDGVSASLSRSQSTAADASEGEDSTRSAKKPTNKRKKASTAGDEGRETKARKTAKGRAGTRVRKGRGAKTSSSEKKSAKAHEDEASGSENEFVPPSGGVSAEPTREMALRTRVKPRPAFKSVDAVEPAAPEESASEGSEYYE